jgi:hypothetical protein
MLVIVPARVAGLCQVGDRQMNLKQYFQVVRGTIGTQEAIGRLRGDQITLTAGGAEYTGRVTGDHIEGQATMGGSHTPWAATRAK